MFNYDHSQFQSWLKGADPSQITQVIQSALNEVNTRNSNQRDQVITSLKGDPTTSRFLEQVSAKRGLGLAHGRPLLGQPHDHLPADHGP